MEAVRTARRHPFHIITMDQTLSEDYCASVVKAQDLQGQEVEAAGGTWEPPSSKPIVVPPPLRLDANRLETAKRRTEYFNHEIMTHQVLPGDGSMDGHMAMATILSLYKEKGRSDAPIVFNLTGNVMEHDRERYLKSGSSGVLPKPTKLEEFMTLLRSRLETFVRQGVATVDSQGCITTPDGNFCFSRVKQSRESSSDGLKHSATIFTPTDTLPPPIETNIESNEESSNNGGEKPMEE